jgi:hypothetical protein
VLKEIQRQTGIMIHVKGRIAGTLTQEFEDLPLERGLRMLFREANLAFFYTAGASTATLAHVWLFPREGITAAERPIHRAAAGRAAAQQDDRGS